MLLLQRGGSHVLSVMSLWGAKFTSGKGQLWSDGIVVVVVVVVVADVVVVDLA